MTYVSIACQHSTIKCLNQNGEKKEGVIVEGGAYHLN